MATEVKKKGHKNNLLLIGEIKCDHCEKVINNLMWTAEIHPEVYFTFCFKCRKVDMQYRIDKKYDALEYELYSCTFWDHEQLKAFTRTSEEYPAETRWQDYVLWNDWLQEIGFDEDCLIGEQEAKDYVKATKLNLILSGWTKENWTSLDNEDGIRTLEDCINYMKKHFHFFDKYFPEGISELGV